MTICQKPQLRMIRLGLLLSSRDVLLSIAEGPPGLKWRLGFRTGPIDHLRL